jgi:flagellar basal-body rod protein FlgG
MGQGGAVALNPENIEQDLFINQAGEIILDGEIVDTLDIVTFSDLKKLERDGQNIFSYSGETTDEIQAGQASVEYRALEKSNTRVVEEMARMIDYNRMFETFTKSMMTFDEIDGKAINDVGTLR